VSRALPVTAAPEQGFAVHELHSRTAVLRMVPELGGRIVGLRSLATGREWCWHQDRPDWLWANREGDGFGMGTQAGVDECVPTVAPCRVRGRDLPDHGEVWARAWTLDPAALAQGVLRSEVALSVSPFVFTRSIAAGADGSFAFDYALANRGTSAEPFLWCLHPLLALRPGDRIELPAEVRELRLNGGLWGAARDGEGVPPLPAPALGDRWAWPEPFPGVRLDACEVPGGTGGCVKGFAGPLAEGRAAVGNGGSGDRLELSWSAAEVPWLGLWLNRGHGGFHHLGLEPATGAPDALADATGAWGPPATVPAGGTVRWSITLSIS
jgi:galactose mutarotase-like enzyme